MDFLKGVAIELVGGLIAGVIVAGLAYLFIEQRFHLRRSQAARRELLGTILSIIKRELEFAVEQIAIFRRQNPEEGLPVPLFDVNGWALLSQAPAATALNRELLENLVPLYNRLRTANEVHRTALEFVAGSTAAIVHATTAVELPSEQAAAAQDAFVRHRQDAVWALVKRIDELEPLLLETLAQVRNALSQVEDNSDAAPPEASPEAPAAVVAGGEPSGR